MKICQILLVPALLLAFIKQANASSGCDLDSNIADGCSGLTSCTLSNGYATGSCCNSSNLCDIDEGDCDADSDCDGDLICGSNNCVSPFPATHDCCIRDCDNYITITANYAFMWYKRGLIEMTLPEKYYSDGVDMEIEFTFDDNWVGDGLYDNGGSDYFCIYFCPNCWNCQEPVAEDSGNYLCSGSTCTFGNQEIQNTNTIGVNGVSLAGTRNYEFQIKKSSKITSISFIFGSTRVPYCATSSS